MIFWQPPSLPHFKDKMAGSKKRKKSKELVQQGHALADGHSDVQGQAMEDGRALIFVRTY